MEDNQINQTMMKKMLSKLGDREINLAENALEAVEAVKKIVWKYFGFCYFV